MTKQTKQDLAILEVSGHPQGPRFNGPNAVYCHSYDDHRWSFFRRDGEWTCPHCTSECDDCGAWGDNQSMEEHIASRHGLAW